MKSKKTWTNSHFGVMWGGKIFNLKTNGQTKQKSTNPIFLWFDLFWTLNEDKSLFETNFLSVIKTGFEDKKWLWKGVYF